MATHNSGLGLNSIHGQKEALLQALMNEVQKSHLREVHPLFMAKWTRSAYLFLVVRSTCLFSMIVVANNRHLQQMKCSQTL